MPFTQTEFPGLLIFEPIVYEDRRGYFFESYNENIFKEQHVDLRFVQDNQSSSAYGIIRGLHYQLNPQAQTKLVRALSGTILDVVVDIRKNSPTYSRVFSIELSAENRKQLFIPPGFAHGFSVLSEWAEVFYKCDEFYNKQLEAGICFSDPFLNIDWKVPPEKVTISEKDQQLPLFAECNNNFE
jgi:dTDP-4-dehydrorhamnose 3,5-epimerase